MLEVSNLTLVPRQAAHKPYKQNIQKKKKMEERDPWAAFGSKKFPFPNRKMSDNLVKCQQCCG